MEEKGINNIADDKNKTDQSSINKKSDIIKNGKPNSNVSVKTCEEISFLDVLKSFF